MTQSQRFKIFQRDGFRCRYCGSGDRLTVDHVVPRSKGGANTVDNLVTACAACNAGKGANTADVPPSLFSAEDAAPEVFSLFPPSPPPVSESQIMEAFRNTVAADLPTLEKVAMLVMISDVVADGPASVFRSYAEIAKMTGLSRRATCRVVGALVERGLIKRKSGGPETSNEYTLEFGAIAMLLPHTPPKKRRG